MNKNLLHTFSLRSLPLIMAAIAMIVTTTVSAQTKVKIDDFYYILDDASLTAELAASEDTGTYATGRVTVPSSVTSDDKTYEVTKIGDFAFSFNTGITSVVIPLSLQEIGDGAFQGCTKLSSVTFRMTKLLSIGDAAFEGCSSLGSITIPATTKKIGAWAFAETALRSVVIPDSVTSLGGNAFQGCTSLTGVTFKCRLKAIPNSLFSRCTSLSNVLMTTDRRNNIDEIGNAAFFSCSKMTTYNFGDSVSSIGSCSFMSCTSLGKADIPSSVTYIGHDAFAACTAMSAVTLPDNIDSVSDRIFKDAHALKTITMSDSVKYLGEQAFAYCTSLKSAHLSSQITEIPFKAFAYCAKLSDINLPASVTVIGDSAFSNTQAFDSLTIGRNITSIGDYAFANIPTLKYVYMPSTLPSKTADGLGDYIFSGDSIEALYAEWEKGPTVSSGFFTYCDTLYVPQGDLLYYYRRTGWKDAKVKRMYDAVAVGIDDAVVDKKDNDAYYNLEGIRGLNPRKGEIYIHRGRKVLYR